MTRTGMTAFGVLLGLFGAPFASAQDVSPSVGTPLSGNIEMPLVTPEEAMRYLGARQVPESDFVESNEMARTTMSEPLLKADVATVLGHALPTEKLSPFGTERADFAVAGSPAARRPTTEGPMGGAVVVDTQSPTISIVDQPPLIATP